jgi:hypothetical protein
MRTSFFKSLLAWVLLSRLPGLCLDASANWFEWSMNVTANGQPVSYDVFLYFIHDTTAPCRWGTTAEAGLPNFKCDVDLGDNDYHSDETWPLIVSGSYYVRIDTRYARIDIPSTYINADFCIHFDGTNFTIIPSENHRGVILGATHNWSITTVLLSINQTLANGDPVGSVKRWFAPESALGFQDVVPIPSGIPVPFQSGVNQVFLADQAIHSGQKYNNWSNLSDVTNHHVFQINSGTPDLFSHFKATQDGIQVCTDLIDAPGNSGDNVRLKDPWLVDTQDSLFYESPYGYRNLGMEAPFKSEQSGFTFGTSTKYKGVFLNENPDPNNPQKPYYSVGATITQTIGGVEAYFME